MAEDGKGAVEGQHMEEFIAAVSDRKGLKRGFGFKIALPIIAW
jgi:hypothetical protein